MAKTDELFNIAFKYEDGGANELKAFFRSQSNGSSKKHFVKNVSKNEAGKTISIKFKQISIPSNVASEESFVSWWKSYRDGQDDKNIYSFYSGRTYTVVAYDSRDYDSVLCKDIILKQYSKTYNRNISDWKANGIIVYDTYTKSTDYPTYEGFGIFYLELLSESATDEVFVCGYCVSSELLSRFSKYNEKLYVFEDNPFKSNEIRSLLKSSNAGKLCLVKSMTKSYQAFLLFRDPIGNIQPEDNIALKVLKDYSSFACSSFSSIDEWRQAESIKKNFEEKVQDESFRRKLVSKLFSESVKDSEFESLYETTVNTNDAFSEQFISNSMQWAGNAIAINTDEVPTVGQVEHYVLISKACSQLITFYKHDNTFWSVKAYRAPRELVGFVSTTDALPNVDYYLPTGIIVRKTISKNGLSVEDVKWHIVSSQKKLTTELNVFVKDAYGDYGLKMSNGNAGYEKLPEGTLSEAQKAYYLCSDNEVVKFSPSDAQSNSIFFEVLPSNDIITFNKVSLIDLMSSKCYARGNKYAIEASLSDKQMYKCLVAKSLS